MPSRGRTVRCRDQRSEAGHVHYVTHADWAGVLENSSLDILLDGAADLAAHPALSRVARANIFGIAAR
jgi:hypothetical protein